MNGNKREFCMSVEVRGKPTQIKRPLLSSALRRPRTAPEHLGSQTAKCLETLSFMPSFRLSHLSRSSRYMQSSLQSTLSGTSSASAVPTKARLPRMPVPDLHQTLQKYLASLEPFVLENYGRDPVQLQNTFATRRQWADDFERGVGSVLQERLQGQPFPKFYASSS